MLNKINGDWIWTWVLWCRNWPLCQLCHDHYLSLTQVWTHKMKYLSVECDIACILQWVFLNPISSFKKIKVIGPIKINLCWPDLHTLMFEVTALPIAPQHKLVQKSNPGLFLFIFVHYKHKFCRKTVGFSGIRTWVVEVQGEHADHLTTTTALVQKSFPCNFSQISTFLSIKVKHF